MKKFLKPRAMYYALLICEGSRNVNSFIIFATVLLLWYLILGKVYKAKSPWMLFSRIRFLFSQFLFGFHNLDFFHFIVKRTVIYWYDNNRQHLLNTHYHCPQGASSMVYSVQWFAFCMIGISLNVLQVLLHLILIIILWVSEAFY